MFLLTQTNNEPIQLWAISITVV